MNARFEITTEETTRRASESRRGKRNSKDFERALMSQGKSGKNAYVCSEVGSLRKVGYPVFAIFRNQAESHFTNEPSAESLSMFPGKYSASVALWSGNRVLDVIINNNVIKREHKAM
mmetsp:Transcript_20574/g.30463  ORF Transcript_20574/g.30463 Transcript_20574/m.30463 type:complete len:117 (-) Transcript_20574:25-375(-)